MAAVHSVRHPRLAVRLALGHKYNAWYLIFAQPYRTADCREISRLDSPGPAIAWSPRPRFWFNQKAASGWERGGESLLDLLLSLDFRDPPLFAVVDHDSGANKVEVLLPENKLAHYCEGCGQWEVAGNNAVRWFMVRAHTLPGYLCPPCHAKDWIGARAIRYLKRIRYRLWGDR
ncbi:hypothetical protein B0H17DRAFT_1181037 [Mycena rosella]|uniref:Uncharacterized protein n=1 Tax=Mycena rosella TaxID=1033263 RepID=A0AAD7DBY3_MYCRO|nr:hypothetical protein B0H17DRAFT_1181037 [Mycena rosella]